jgi:hypothetical protein
MKRSKDFGQISETGAGSCDILPVSKQCRMSNRAFQPTYRSGVQMEEMVASSHNKEANATPPPVATGTRSSGRRLRWIPLALAMVWLVASVIVGAELMQAETANVSAPTVPIPALSPTSEHSVYGGDAYTGIQNAASDTEHSLVDGVNQLAAFQLALAQAVAKQDSQRSSSMQSEIQKGLGFLIIGLGVLNFTVALTRASGFDRTR